LVYESRNIADFCLPSNPDGMAKAHVQGAGNSQASFQSGNVYVEICLNLGHWRQDGKELPYTEQFLFRPESPFLSPN